MYSFFEVLRNFFDGIYRTSYFFYTPKVIYLFAKWCVIFCFVVELLLYLSICYICVY